MNKKNILTLLVIAMVVISSQSAFAGQKSKKASTYNPPFKMSGVVKEISNDSLHIYIPTIEKEITAVILPDTEIFNRLTDSLVETPDKIKIEDLVVVEGVLKEEQFLCRKISYLPMAEK